MKKTTHIQLVLITAALASCHQPNKDWEASNGNIHVRTDSTAPYSRPYHHHSSPGIWYYAFRPYGYYYGDRYQRMGYYSDAIGEQSNIGNNVHKSGIVRGGFGNGGYTVSS